MLKESSCLPTDTFFSQKQNKKLNKAEKLSGAVERVTRPSDNPRLNVSSVGELDLQQLSDTFLLWSS